MSVLATLDRRFLPEAPARRLATLRLLVGSYAVVSLLVQTPRMADFRSMDPARFEAAGLSLLLDSALPPWIPMLLFATCICLGCAFAVGARFKVTGPLFALLYLWVTSYRSSWGMVFHNDNLAVLHVMVLGLSASADSLSWDARQGRRVDGDKRRYGWPIRLMVALTVTTYFIAGMAKLRNSGMAWGEGEILRNYIAYDCVRKMQLGSMYSPVGVWLVQYAWPFPIIGMGSLAMELGAPLAFFSARFGRVWALLAWSFHVGVWVVMAITFSFPISGIAMASLFPCERLWKWRFLQVVPRFFTPAP